MQVKTYQKEIMEKFKTMDGKKVMLIPRCRGKSYIHLRQDEAIKQHEKLNGTNPTGIIFNECPDSFSK